MPSTPSEPSARERVQRHPDRSGAARPAQRRQVPHAARLHGDQGRHQGHGECAAPIAVGRKPQWLRAPMPAGRGFDAVRATVKEHRLATVCEEAKCPNIGECWNAGTATLMLMGAVCTRACRFCSVDTGNPHGWLDAEEPRQQRAHRAADGAEVRRADIRESRRSARWRRGAFRSVRARDQASRIRTPPSRRSRPTSRASWPTSRRSLRAASKCSRRMSKPCVA